MFMNFKNIILLFTIMILSLPMYAQFDYNPRENSRGGNSWIFRNSRDRNQGSVRMPRNNGGADGEDYKKNGIKLNTSALGYRNISLQYERMFPSKLSLLLGLRTSIPSKGFVLIGGSGNTGDPEIDAFYSNIRLTSISLAPEVRKYFGKRPGKGFYLGLLGKYDSYNLNAPRQFIRSDNTTTDIKFGGNTTFVGGGLSIGAQFIIKKRFCFDWWIGAPMYGNRSLELKATSTNFGFSTTDLAELNAENPFKGLETIFGNVSSTINNQEISYKISGGAPALRVGYCIGYMF
jgi:hypothetical protein